MDNIAIVILNYQAYQETVKCVESIREKKIKTAGIVIVDNASTNASYKYLCAKYRDVPEIKVVRCSSNLGFAKGNNIGIKVAKRSWEIDGVLLLNSDTVMLESDYLEKMINAYQPGIGVMQTSALRLNGRYTRKDRGTYSIKELLFYVLRERAAYYNVYFPFQVKITPENELDRWVSGCDFLLTRDYFQVFDGLYPLTFLYGEEYILSTMVRKAGLKLKIVEEAHILHAESRSTPDDFKAGRRKKQKMVLRARLHILLVRLLPLPVLRWLVNQKEWNE